MHQPTVPYWAERIYRIDPKKVDKLSKTLSMKYQKLQEACGRSVMGPSFYTDPKEERVMKKACNALCQFEISHNLGEWVTFRDHSPVAHPLTEVIEPN